MQTIKQPKAGKVTKATAAEIADYAKTDALYPLSHWVIVDGARCAVERITSSNEGDPKYEIMLPDGHHDLYDNCHTLLCFDMADVRDRAEYSRLTKCNDDC